MLKLIIGNKKYSSWSFRPWLLMKVMEIPFKEVRIAIHRPDSLKKILHYTPAGRVPVLIDGRVKVWESMAIGHYLAEKFPKKFLWPKDPVARAVAYSVAHEMHAGFQGMRQALPCHFLVRYHGFSVPSSAQADIDRVESLWTDCRKKWGKGGPFLFGNFSVADAMYAPVVYRWLAYGVVPNRVCRDYMSAIESLPASREWVGAARHEKEVISDYENKGKIAR